MRRLLQRWLRARRDRRILRQQGCLMFCPNPTCGCTLNDPRHPARSEFSGNERSILVCRLCGCWMEWLLGIAPVPILHSSVWGPLMERRDG